MASCVLIRAQFVFVFESLVFIDWVMYYKELLLILSECLKEIWCSNKHSYKCEATYSHNILIRGVLRTIACLHNCLNHGSGPSPDLILLWVKFINMIGG